MGKLFSLVLLVLVGCTTTQQKQQTASQQVTSRIQAADARLAPVVTNLEGKRDTANAAQVKAARADLAHALTSEAQHLKLCDRQAAELTTIKESTRYRIGGTVLKLVGGMLVVGVLGLVLRFAGGFGAGWIGGVVSGLGHLCITVATLGGNLLKRLSDSFHNKRAG